MNKEKLVYCGNKTCPECQIPDGSCWRYSEPTLYPGGEKDCPGYMPVNKEEGEINDNKTC